MGKFTGDNLESQNEDDRVRDETLILDHSIIAAISENTKWLKTVAIILGDMQNICPSEIYEDLE